MIEVIGVIFTAIAAIVGLIALTHQVKSRRSSKINKAPKESVLKILTRSQVGPENTKHDFSVIDVASKFVFLSPKGTFNTGLFSKVTASVFLDLFSACTDLNNRSILAESLSNKVKELENQLSITFDCVAVPKEGNVLLGDRVARMLSLPLVVVRSGKAIRFGYPLEGNMSPGWSVILVDDISSDGRFLKTCITRLRKYGAVVGHCFCVFERTDGNTSELLSDLNVKLHHIRQINDEDLLSLARL